MKGQSAIEPESFAPHITLPFTRSGLRIALEHVTLIGDLDLPEDAQGLVVFVHGSGSSRLSPRNRYVAEVLRRNGSGTLLFDLLTEKEEAFDAESGELRFDIGFLASRLKLVTNWLGHYPPTRSLGLGYFGASTGAAAALVAAAALPERIKCIVSRGGRPDLARAALLHVEAPTLLIVGGDDEAVLELNEEAFRHLHCPKELRVIPGATHLFAEPGALEAVAEIAATWFRAAWSCTKPT